MFLSLRVAATYRKLSKWPGVDPIFALDGHWMVKLVQDFYGIQAMDLSPHLLTRALQNDAPRKIYFMSKAVKDLLDSGAEEFLRMPVLGVKVWLVGCLFTVMFMQLDAAPVMLVGLVHNGLCLLSVLMLIG